MDLNGALLLSVLANVFLVSVVALIGFELKESQKARKRQNRHLDSLERAFRDDGGQTCCACGKPYQALNDPDYSPELNICRDCMWKMYYGQTFGDDHQTATDDHPFAFEADRDTLENTLGAYRRETYG